MITTQPQTSQQPFTSTFSRSTTPNNNVYVKTSPIFSEKRTLSKSNRRKRSESISSPNSSTNGQIQNPQKPQLQNEYRNQVPQSIPCTSLMHWSKIKTIGKAQPKPLRAHSMTLVNEKIFIFGGSDVDTCYNDLYIFDAETYWWSVHKTKGICPPPRPCRAHSANLIGDKIFIFGGGNGPNYFNTLFLLDTKTLCWEKPEVRGQIPNPRRAHTSWVYNDLLYIFAGGDGMCALNDVYVLAKEEDVGNTSNTSNTTTTDSNTPTSSMVVPNANMSGSMDTSMDSSFTGLNRMDLMGIGSNEDKETIHFELPNKSNSVSNQKYVRGMNGTSTPTNLTTVTTTSTNTNGSMNSNSNSDSVTGKPSSAKRVRYIWTKVTTTGKAPSPRGYHSSSLVGNKVIIYGGSDGHECFSEIFILDLEKNHWSKVSTDRPIPRLSHTATQVGSYLFIIGGHDGNRYSHSLLLLNLVTLRWEVRKVCGEKPTSRGYHSAVLFDSRIFLFGGYDGHKVFNDMYVLDLSSSAYLPQITEFEIGGITN